MSLCQKRRSDSEPCGAQAVAGTDACRVHAGRPLAEQRAKGQVVVELSKWGISDRTLDPGVTLLQLMTQSFQRAKLYGQLLEEAYDAAERLAETSEVHGAEPPNAGTKADRERAQQDLDRVFTHGGVSALIGSKWSASPGEFGSIYQTEEAIRGLVQLEAQERDRAAGMAAKAVAAGLATRQVELAEKQGELVADVIRAVLTQLGHDLADPDVLRVVSTQLRALGPAA
jgi:hypothetical protein